MSYIAFLMLYFFTANAQVSTKIPIIIEKSEEVKPVVADVVIKAGKVVSSNCDQLGQADSQTEYTLELDLNTNIYNCVPKNNKKIFQETAEIDLGFEPTAENFRKELEDIARAIQTQEGYVQPTPPQPQCSLDSSGNINLDTCTCGLKTESSYQFNKTTKTCESTTSGILDLYVRDCSDQYSDVLGLLKEIGYNTVEPPSIEFGMCVDWRNLKYYIPSQDLVYRILYFSYFLKPYMMNVVLKDEKVDAVKLLVTQRQLNIYNHWVSTKMTEVQAEVDLLPVFGYGDPLEQYQEKIKNFAQELQDGYILKETVVVEKP
jgi:hypothetical protein